MENNNTATLRSKSQIYADMDRLAKRAPDVKRLTGAKKLAYARLKLEIAQIELAASPDSRLEKESVQIYEEIVASLAKGVDVRI